MLALEGVWRVSWRACPTKESLIADTAACSVVGKLLDLDPQGRWFDPWPGHGMAQLLGP